MTRKAIFARLAAIAAAIALMFALSSGDTDKLHASALAEEEFLPAAEAGMDSQAAEEENGAADPAEENPETAENKEEIASLFAEEGIFPDPAEEDPEITENRQETAPPAAEEAGESADEKTATVPEAETGSEEAKSEPVEAGPVPEEVKPEPEELKPVPEEVKPVPEEVKPEPENERESEQPEEPSGGRAARITDPGNEEDLNIFEEHDAGHVSEELTEPFDHPDHDGRQAFTGTAEIRLMNEGMLNYGDRIVLKAEIRDVNTDYRLVWEACDHDDYGWFAVGSGEEYSFFLDKNNAGREYRVTIMAVD